MLAPLPSFNLSHTLPWSPELWQHREALRAHRRGGGERTHLGGFQADTASYGGPLACTETVWTSLREEAPQMLPPQCFVPSGKWLLVAGLL